MSMSWIPLCFHWPFCPGVFIAILAVLAAGMTFWEKPPRLVRVFVIFVFLMLMVAEVMMMSKDRDAHDKAEQLARNTENLHFEATMAKFENLQSTTNNLREAKTRVQRVIAQPAENLKKRAILLSQDILQFLADRAKAQPQSGFTSYNTREELVAAMNKEMQEDQQYYKETGSQYLSKFGVRVAGTLHELNERGIDIGNTEERCTWAGDVGNTVMLQECGVNLGLFGERLPN